MVHKATYVVTLFLLSPVDELVRRPGITSSRHDIRHMHALHFPHKTKLGISGSFLLRRQSCLSGGRIEKPRNGVETFWFTRQLALSRCSLSPVNELLRRPGITSSRHDIRHMNKVYVLHFSNTPPDEAAWN